MHTSFASGAENTINLVFTLSGVLAKHMPAHAVRGLEADLRALAGARRRAGDRLAWMVISNVATSLVASRPELFGH